MDGAEKTTPGSGITSHKGEAARLRVAGGESQDYVFPPIGLIGKVFELT